MSELELGDDFAMFVDAGLVSEAHGGNDYPREMEDGMGRKRELPHVFDFVLEDGNDLDLVLHSRFVVVAADDGTKVLESVRLGDGVKVAFGTESQVSSHAWP
jgi:hypothetical protein